MAATIAVVILPDRRVNHGRLLPGNWGIGCSMSVLFRRCAPGSYAGRAGISPARSASACTARCRWRLCADLLLFFPLSLALRYLFDAQPLWVFLTGGIAFAVLADWIRRAAEQVAPRHQSIDFKFIFEFRMNCWLVSGLAVYVYPNFQGVGP